MRKLTYNPEATRWAVEGTIVDTEHDDIVVARVEDIAITLASGDCRLEPDHNFGRQIAAVPALLAALEGILQSAGYVSGEAESTLRELNVGIPYLDRARAALAQADGEGRCSLEQSDLAEQAAEEEREPAPASNHRERQVRAILGA